MQSEDCAGLIDTHCHLDLEPLYANITTVLADARAAGVTHFVVPGVHPEGWERMAIMAQSHQGIYPAFGIHPMHADCADGDRLSRLADLSAGHAVAIGEIGLDPSYAVSMERQERSFREQLRLAVSLGLPILIHCRKAFQRVYRILQDEGAHHAGGIMHAYSGSPEMAREFIRLGFAISISGMVTRDYAVRLPALVRALPLESLVLETDAPDLTPKRYNGQPNQPAYIIEVLQAVAQIKNIDVSTAGRFCCSRTRAVLSRLQPVG